MPDRLETTQHICPYTNTLSRRSPFTQKRNLFTWDEAVIRTFRQCNSVRRTGRILENGGCLESFNHLGLADPID